MLGMDGLDVAFQCCGCKTQMNHRHVRCVWSNRASTCFVSQATAKIPFLFLFR